MIALSLIVLLPLVLADVTELTKDGFDSKVSEVEYTLVMFYAPWCGHCKHLKPHFEEASKLLANAASNVRLARLDCTEHGEKCSEFGVTGYPTVKLFKNGVFHKEYDGPRDTDGIRAFMMKHSQPPSKKLLTMEDYTSFTSRGDSDRLPTVVAYFKEEGDSLKSFQDVASDFISDVLFAHTHDPTILGSKEMTAKALGDWIRKTQYNDKHFSKNKLLVFYFNASLDGYPKGVNYHRNRLMKLLKSLKSTSDLKFAYSFSGDYYHELSDLGEADGPFPVVAIYSSGKKYKLPDYSPEKLVEFIEKFRDGKLTPHIKSEPVPEPSDEATVTAVGTTFEEIVNDGSKDVFIMFHAPWCGHCKNLMPKFKEAAEKLRSEPSVKFVLYDATANDIPEPYSVRGYPTLYFAPKNSKDTPKRYEGPREVDDLIKFVAKESTQELRGYNREGAPKKEDL
ncbi:unnamed protein product [Echinostoma caproni]|uniref:protein disulfide-isomerase n=1 Tax=Echinostoma caproni TaxID=27848 RepID=A0A183AV33_9TREM|nr:unnamed protein product [Echinostoma caproni]